MFLRTFQIVSKKGFLLRPLVCEKSGEFEAPVERRNIQNSHQVPVDGRIWQGLNIQTIDFWREMVSNCVLKPYDSQTTATHKRTGPFQALARISQIPKRHVWTRNRSPFQLQIDFAPKSRNWPPLDVEAQIFCLFHRLYQVNKACAKFHDSTTSFDCISWDSIWWVRSGYGYSTRNYRGATQRLPESWSNKW